jgi:tryptophan synthase alpha chain
MNGINEKFSSLKRNKQKALITFITAGDPDAETTVKAIKSMEEAGADIIEIGIPYSDPLADGPTIQASSTRALKNGIKIPIIMDMVKKARKISEVPLVFLVYYNSIFKYGIEKFLEESSKAGISGIIIPDLPLEERAGISDLMGKKGMILIPLVAPTSRERIRAIVEHADGFVYCVSVNGVTGAREKIGTDLKSYMNTIAQFTDVPRALGFGISSAAMVREVKDYCDGVIVGSAIINVMTKFEDRDEMLENLKKFVSELKNGLSEVRI